MACSSDKGTVHIFSLAEKSAGTSAKEDGSNGSNSHLKVAGNSNDSSSNNNLVSSPSATERERERERLSAERDGTTLSASPSSSSSSSLPLFTSLTYTRFILIFLIMPFISLSLAVYSLHAQINFLLLSFFHCISFHFNLHVL